MGYVSKFKEATLILYKQTYYIEFDKSRIKVGCTWKSYFIALGMFGLSHNLIEYISGMVVEYSNLFQTNIYMIAIET